MKTEPKLCPECGREMIYQVGNEITKLPDMWVCPNFDKCGHQENVIPPMILEVCERPCRTCPDRETCSGALEWGAHDEEKAEDK